MASKYDQLAQLKALLDSGALTQEEFDAAKKRILEADDAHTSKDSTPDSDKSQAIQNQGTEQETSPEVEAPIPTYKKSTRWIIIGGVAAIAIIVSVILAASGNKNDSYSPESKGYAADFSVLEDTLDISDDNEEIGNELSLGNPWRKDYWENEWGEDIPTSPFIYTVLDGTGWDIHIDYTPPSDENQTGLFRFYLVDEQGNKVDSFGPVRIFVRGIGGETLEVPITGTRDGITFIEEPSVVAGLGAFFNKEEFDIRMEFEKYNERHATQTHCKFAFGSFQEAVDKLL